jgi:hypothetical protein
MRQIHLAAVALGLALIVVACQATPEPTAIDATDEVLHAALATQAGGTLRFTVDVRATDPDDATPPVTGSGQVSFGEPIQFRFARPGVSGTIPPSETIFDGDRLFVRGDDSRLPADTWLLLETSSVGRDMVMRQESDSLLVLVTPLGVTSAERAEEDTIGTRAVTRFITQVDVAAARRHLTDSLMPAYESRMSGLEAAGVPLTHEVEIWVDDEGRIARTRYLQELKGQDIEALVITYDFEGYGDPMDPAPPAGDEVLTLDEATERYQNPLASPGTS